MQQVTMDALSVQHKDLYIRNLKHSVLRAPGVAPKVQSHYRFTYETHPLLVRPER